MSASATYSDSTGGFTVAGAQAFSKQTESMTFGGATGTGFYRPTFTVDGSLFNVGRTEDELACFCATDSGPAFLGFRIQNSRGSISYYGPGGYTTVFPGMSVSGDLATGLTVSGSTTFALSIPITFGTPTDIKLALWAGTLAGSSVGLLAPSSGEVNCLSTVALTGIVVTDGSSNPLDSLSIRSGLRHAIRPQRRRSRAGTCKL
ncbi:MAG: hypothetical protein ABI612_04260, partial [Betaproteobacteria bacterium]